jgi:hypothetical protein
MGAVIIIPRNLDVIDHSDPSIPTRVVQQKKHDFSGSEQKNIIRPGIFLVLVAVSYQEVHDLRPDVPNVRKKLTKLKFQTHQLSIPPLVYTHWIYTSK